MKAMCHTCHGSNLECVLDQKGDMMPICLTCGEKKYTPKSENN